MLSSVKAYRGNEGEVPDRLQNPDFFTLVLITKHLRSLSVINGKYVWKISTSSAGLHRLISRHTSCFACAKQTGISALDNYQLAGRRGELRDANADDLPPVHMA